MYSNLFCRYVPLVERNIEISNLLYQNPRSVDQQLYTVIVEIHVDIEVHKKVANIFPFVFNGSQPLRQYVVHLQGQVLIKDEDNEQ